MATKAHPLTAVIAVDGRQLQVTQGKTLLVDKCSAAVGDVLTFDKVLLVLKGNETIVGTPYLPNASVKAEVIGTSKAKKVIVFKKKRRKGYKVKRGSRKQHSSISIKAIDLDNTKAS